MLDSCTKFTDYIDYAVALGQKAICISEHGKLYNWVAKKMYCDEKGIKYLHGVECYLTETHTEKVRDNFHTVLIAKNYQGLLEINQATSLSEEDSHTYYKNRISFDEFLNLSNNVIKISACLASPLNRLDISNEYYDKLARHYDYYEIQPHNNKDQKMYNLHLAQLSQKHKKPLIAGTDTHSLNKYKAECRSILQLAKRIEYSDEDSFDLTYKTYDELVEMFRIQDSLPENIFLEAIENTNIMAESVEGFELDFSFKYPILYGNKEKDIEMYEKTVLKMFDEKVESGVISESDIDAFKLAIEEENRVFAKIGMQGFMLFMSELATWCNENNIPIGFNRGSVGGSRVSYITNITDMNPEQWHTVFSRFCNEDRVEIGDIDLDFAPNDRDKVYEYIINRFGQKYTAFILAIGTIGSKGTIDEIGRALSIKWERDNPDEPKSKNPYSLDVIAKVKKEFDQYDEITKLKYPEIFYYYDGLINTAISQSMHPAGIVASPITLQDNYGTLVRDGKTILQIDMECVHEVSLVKYDILGLKNIEIIKEAYKLLDKPYPKSHEIDWNDEKVWADIIQSPIGIFQFEGEYAHSLLRLYQPKSIFDMSLITAALRPSGASYRDDLMQHIPNKNPSEIIDDLLKDNNGYLVYQEDVIKFLQLICGFSGSEADNTRRAIGRKDEERLQKVLPKILEGYCNKSSKPREVAEEEVKAFIKIIEDASSYMFGYNHSIGYCMIGYLCGYLRYYYPYEFITAYLNNANNEDDVKNGSNLAQEYNIRITPPKFGLSKDIYIFNKDKQLISKGISSVKFLNSKVANELYELSQNIYDTFTDLLLDIKNKTSTNARQLNILIDIDYFSNFGNSVELKEIYKIFDLLDGGSVSSIKTDKIPNAKLLEIIEKYATNLNAKSETSERYTFTSNILQAKKADISFVDKEITLYKKTEFEKYIASIKIIDETCDTSEACNNCKAKKKCEFYKLQIKNIKSSIMDEIEIPQDLAIKRDSLTNEYKKIYAIHMHSLLLECEDYINKLNLPDLVMKEKIEKQIEFLGYIDLTTGNEEDRRKLLVTDVYSLNSKDNGNIWGYAVFTRSIGSGKNSRLTVMSRIYNTDPLNKMDIIYAKSINKNKSGYWYLNDYEKIK